MAELRLRDSVKRTMVRSGPGLGGIGGSLGANVGEPTIDLELNDANVQDILDSLATASTKKIWIVTFSNNSAPTETGVRPYCDAVEQRVCA